MCYMGSPSTADPITTSAGFSRQQGPPTVPLTRVLRNAVFFESQNPHKAGTLCNYLVHADFVHAEFLTLKKCTSQGSDVLWQTHCKNEGARKQECFLINHFTHCEFALLLVLCIFTQISAQKFFSFPLWAISQLPFVYDFCPKNIRSKLPSKPIRSE